MTKSATGRESPAARDLKHCAQECETIDAFTSRVAPNMFPKRQFSMVKHFRFASEEAIRTLRVLRDWTDDRGPSSATRGH